MKLETARDMDPVEGGERRKDLTPPRGLFE